MSTSTINCIIIDDDALVTASIKHLLESAGDLVLLKSFHSPLEALEFLRSNPVDLAFVDVLMPEMNGFELLNELDQKPGVIICSNKKEFAVEAYGINAIDYLHKPIHPERFQQAINKFRKWQKEQLKNQGPRNALFLKVDSVFRKVEFSEIIFIEKDGNYLKVVTDKGELLPYSTMKELESKLPGNQFFRVHRSYIVNMQRVDGLDENFLITDKKLIPMSKDKKKDIYDYLGLS